MSSKNSGLPKMGMTRPLTKSLTPAPKKGNGTKKSIDSSSMAVVNSNSAKISPDKVVKTLKRSPVRIKEIVASNDLITEIAEHTLGSDADAANEDEDDGGIEDGSDEEFDASGDAKDVFQYSSRRNRPDPTTQQRTPNPNGRVVGRKLVMWHRPRMMEKLLLHLQYECQREGLILPWEKVVKRLSPGSSGAAATQHLNKVRDVLIAEGHMVPPLAGKLGTYQDPTIRGYTRDTSSNDPTVVRAISWDETIVDLKESLEIPGVIRGSGAYRKLEVQKRLMAQDIMKEAEAIGIKIERGTNLHPDTPYKVNTELRNGKHGFLKAQLPKPSSRLANQVKSEQTTMNSKSVQIEAGTPIKALPRRRRPARKAEEAEEVTEEENFDPADLDSDDEWDPYASKSSRRGGKITKKVIVEVDSDEEMASDDDALKEDTDNESVFTQANKNIDSRLVTPPPSLPIKLSLDPELLKDFPPGINAKGYKKSKFSDNQSPEYISDDEGSDFHDVSYESPSVTRYKKVIELRARDEVGSAPSRPLTIKEEYSHIPNHKLDQVPMDKVAALFCNDDFFIIDEQDLFTGWVTYTGPTRKAIFCGLLIADRAHDVEEMVNYDLDQATLYRIGSNFGAMSNILETGGDYDFDEGAYSGSNDLDSNMSILADITRGSLAGQHYELFH